MSPFAEDPNAPSMDRLVASRYRLRELLGSGGMATVYRADDESLGRTVAIKLFHAELANASDERRQREEIGLLAGLNHPSLVTLFDAVSGDEESYLVMEFVQGFDLRERLSSGVLDPREAARIGADVASALSYIHSRAVVHRDVKPANILLSDDDRASGRPRAKLADFGIARLIDSTRLTATGTLIGTASFLSPEQVMGGEVGSPSDVYSLALVLLECLTGERAFPGSPAESAVARLARDPEIPERVGPVWTALLGAATARDPEQRPTAEEFAARLRTLGDDEATLVLPTSASGDTTERMQPPLIAEVPTQRLMPPTEAPHPARIRESRGLSSGRLAAMIVVISVVGLAGALLALGATTSSLGPLDAESRPPSPTVVPMEYPAVDGELGTHLEQLQESVTP